MTVYVYFIYDNKTRNTKIGKTINLKERFSTLKISNPNIRLVYYTDENNEKYYHSLFKEKKVSGEWFRLSKDDYKAVINKKVKLPKALFYSNKEIPTMAHISKKREVEIDGYYFTGIEGLFFHSGKFWFNEEEVKQVYNNGSLSILLYGVSKKSIKKLRKQARRCKIKLFTESLPF